MRTIDKSAAYWIGTYNDLAVEYYDAVKHPTCANFREASRALLMPWLRKLAEADTHVLEVGAGRSVVWEWQVEDRRPLRSFVATDFSLEMLLYSQSPDVSPDLVVCDAERLPFASNSFDVIVSSLGDPYNTSYFWREAARALHAEGFVLFTTPSFEWARQFRNGASRAEFSISGGRAVAVKSYIAPRDLQHQVIEASGLRVIHSSSIDQTKLRSTPRSPKLRPGPIVSIYVARKI